MLSTLTHEDFSKQLDKIFATNINGNSLALELVEIKVLRKSQSQNGRDQFSLLFKGDPHLLLPQQIYQLEHSQMGELDIFLVPIGKESGQHFSAEGAYLYEAIFT